MHIRAFVGAALLALCTLAMMPVAMADPAPDICVLDLAQPSGIDFALNTADMACAVLAAEVDAAVPIGSDDEGVAAGPSMILAHTDFDFGGHRQHEDPGRRSI